MVNVTHYADNGCAKHEILGLILRLIEELFFNGNDNCLFGLCAALDSNQCRGVVVNTLVCCRHCTHKHKLLDNLCYGNLKHCGEIADNDLLGDLHLQGTLLHYHGSGLLLGLSALLILGLALGKGVFLSGLILLLLKLLVSAHHISLVVGYEGVELFVVL